MTKIYFKDQEGLISFDPSDQSYYLIDDSKAAPLLKLDDQDWSFDSAYWKGDFLSWLSHRAQLVHSQNTPKHCEQDAYKAYNNVSQGMNHIPPRIRPLGKSIQLPTSNPDAFQNISLSEALLNRETTRRFDNKPIALEALANVLHMAFSIKPTYDTHGSTKSYRERRASPSSTGLASADCYVIALNVDGLTPGIYFYDCTCHALIVVEEINLDPKVPEIYLDQHWACQAPVHLMMVADLRRTWIKDTSTRGYLANYLDAGHLSQTLLLTATALQLQTWLSGAFRTDVVEALLKLEEYQLPTLSISLGYGPVNPIPRNYDVLVQTP